MVNFNKQICCSIILGDLNKVKLSVTNFNSFCIISSKFVLIKIRIPHILIMICLNHWIGEKIIGKRKRQKDGQIDNAHFMKPYRGPVHL